MIQISINDHNIKYRGLKEYIDDRAKNITELEKRKIFVCTVLEYGFTLLKQFIEKNKKEKYKIEFIFNGQGDIAITSVAVAPTFIIKNVPAGEALTLFRASYCLRNFGKPITLFIKTLDYKSCISSLVTKYSLEIIGKYELLLNTNSSLRSKIYYKLFMNKNKNVASHDPLEKALKKCMNKYEKYTKNWYLVADLYRFLSESSNNVIYTDFEKNDALLIDPSGNCPLKYMTIINLDHGYVAHSADII